MLLSNNWYVADRIYVCRNEEKKFSPAFSRVIVSVKWRCNKKILILLWYAVLLQTLLLKNPIRIYKHHLRLLDEKHCIKRNDFALGHLKIQTLREDRRASVNF